MLVRGVELAPRAERQLAAIEAYYLKEAGPTVADRAVASIIEAAQRLGALPVIYRQAARAGLREYVMDRFPYALSRVSQNNTSGGDHSSEARPIIDTG